MPPTPFEIKAADNWIYSENTRPVLDAISFWIGYSFDESDWLAVENGLANSDIEAGRWFRYPLIGSPPVEIAFAKDPNADPITVEVWLTAAPAPTELLTRLDATLTIFNSFAPRS